MAAVQKALDGIKAAGAPPPVRSHEALAEQLKQGFKSLSASSAGARPPAGAAPSAPASACLRCVMQVVRDASPCLLAGRTVEVSNYGGGGNSNSSRGRPQESYDSYYGQRQPQSGGGGGYTNGGGSAYGSSAGGGYGGQAQPQQQQRWQEPPRPAGTWEVRPRSPVCCLHRPFSTHLCELKCLCALDPFRQVHYTNEGRAYYHNAATGVTQWDPPSGY